MLPVICVSALAALLLVEPTQSNGSDAAKRCATKGQTVVETEAARVWRVRGSETPGFSIESDYVAYGCLKRDGRTRKLGECAGGPDGGCAYAFVLSGRFVGYDDLLASRCCGTTGNFFVTDLSSGTRRKSKDLGDADWEVVDDVVTPRGSAAWIRQESDFEHYRVHRLQNGKDQVLDRGTDIDPKSLRRKGYRVYWRHAGEVRSARLK